MTNNLSDRDLKGFKDYCVSEAINVVSFQSLYMYLLKVAFPYQGISGSLFNYTFWNILLSNFTVKQEVNSMWATTTISKQAWCYAGPLPSVYVQVIGHYCFNTNELVLKNISALKQKFDISAWQCNILYSKNICFAIIGVTSLW